MKPLLFILFAMPILLLGTTNHTITIDGNSTDFAEAGDEDLTTTTGGYTAYLTWDATKLYVGWSGSYAASNDNYYYVYIDTDPSATPASGSGSTTSQQIGTDNTTTLPFTANYAWTYRVEEGGQSTLDKHNGTTWGGAQSHTASISTGTEYIEMSILWSDLGSPSSIYICLNGYANSIGLPGGDFLRDIGPTGNFAGVPDDAITNGSSPIEFLHYYGYTVTSGVSPDASAAYDKSLPVELSVFASHSSSRGVELSWTTDSEIENQAFILSRKSNGESWIEIASFASEKALEGQGSITRSTDYNFVDTEVREGMSYSYQLSDVDYSGKRTDHTDQVETITYVNPGENIRPQTLDLVRLYPNPFNPTVTLSYGLSEMTDLNVSIYSLAGELVWNHNQDSHPAGQNYSLVWNGNDLKQMALPSGIYLVNIQAGTQTLSQKVTLLR